MVVYDKGGNPILVHQRMVKKWPTETDLGFDIASPKAARKFLSEDFRFQNGKQLPHQSRNGDPLVYELYFWGQIKAYMKDAFPEEVKDRLNISLFPGYDKEFEKRDVKRFGHIRK